MKMPLGPTESSTFRSCGLVRVGMDLLGEVCHWGHALRAQILKPGPVCGLFLLPANTDLDISVTTLAPSLPACFLT